MKLLILTRDFYPFSRPSGVTSLLREILPHLADRPDVSTHIISIRKRSENKFHRYGNVPIYKFFYFDIIGILSKLRRIRPDVVIIFSSASRGYLLFLWYYLVSLGFKTKTILYQCTNLKRHHDVFIFRPLLKKYKQIWVTNHALGKYLSKFIAAPKIMRVNPSSNIAPMPSRISANYHSIGFMGHWSYLKGTDIVVEVARSLPQIKFVIIAGIGKEPVDKQIYRDFINNHHAYANIEYIGFTDEPLDYIMQTDILLLPYRSGESVLGVAQSAIEAMALGIPVLSTDNSAISDLLIDRSNGFYCRTVEDFSQKIRLLYADNDLYARLSEGCITTYKNYYQSQPVAKKMWDLIKDERL